MGWSTGWDSKKELTDYLASPRRAGSHARLIASASTISAFFAVWEYTENVEQYKTGDRWLETTLISGGRGNDWGYKDMSETMGPDGCEACPLRFLDMVPDPGGAATEYREKVRAYHAQRARQLEVGAIYAAVGAKGITSFRIESLRPLRGVGSDGRLYRVGKRFIGEKV